MSSEVKQLIVVLICLWTTSFTGRIIRRRILCSSVSISFSDSDIDQNPYSQVYNGKSLIIVL